MRKRKSEEEERRRREKSNGCTLSFYSGYFGDIFWPEKKTVGRKIRSIWWKRFQKSAGQISRHRSKSSVPASLATDGKEKNWTWIQNILPFFFFQVLMQCLQKSPENYYRSLSGKI